MKFARRGVRILKCKIVVPAPKRIRTLESSDDEGAMDIGSSQAILDFDPVIFRLREEGWRVILCDFEHDLASVASRRGFVDQIRWVYHHGKVWAAGEIICAVNPWVETVRIVG